MPAEFFSGQARLLQARCHTLLERLNSFSHLPAELQSYAQNLSRMLSKIVMGVQSLLDDPDFGAAPLLLNQFDDYKRFSELVDIIEWHPLSLLDHYNERDHYSYRFAKLFCEQIQYPYDPPLVNAHSNVYYSSLAAVNMVSVPLSDDKHLLSTPDFVHELGHIVFAHVWKDFTQRFMEYFQPYVEEGKAKAADRAAPQVYQDHFDLLETSWDRYVQEFFCDVFATYLVGPAYGWSHIRLVLSTQDELYHPTFGETGTHPADEARMRVILASLAEMGADTEAEQIREKWGALTSIFVDKPDGEYAICYPDDILLKLSRQVLRLCRGLDLMPFFDQPKDANNLPSLMQEAWEQFHRDPDSYPRWEAANTEALKSFIRTPCQ
jgi:hypothetical protein